MVPHIRGPRSRRRPVALAIAAFLLLLAPSAAAAATPSWLDPQAGWHGRAIERPLAPHSATRPAAAATSTVRIVSAGAGFGTAKGSASVRRVQRALRQLGYAVGPADGRFGPRTRSAVGWFQRKHGLTIDGVAGPRTLERLRERTRDGSGATDVVEDTSRPPAAAAPPAPDQDTQAAPPAAAAPPAPGQDTQAAPPAAAAPPAPGQGTQAAPPATPDAADAADPGDRWLAAAIAVAAILAATLLGLLVRRRRRPAEGTVVSLAQPLWVAGVSSDPAVGHFSGTAAALHVSPTGDSDATPTIRYCVLDDEGGAPVWVSPQDVQESRSVDERQRRRAAAALVDHPAAASPGGRFTRPGARPRRAGALGRRRPAVASHLERRVTWFRSLGMPPEAIADLLADEEIPPPDGHAAWTPAAVAEIGDGGEHHAPASVGRPARAGGTADAEGRSD